MPVGRREILLLIQMGMGAIGFIAGLLHATIYPQRVLVAIMFGALAVATVAALGVRIGPGDRRPPKDPSA